MAPTTVDRSYVAENAAEFRRLRTLVADFVLTQLASTAYQRKVAVISY